jgi:periplasmic divalent cation tolerance protein
MTACACFCACPDLPTAQRLADVLVSDGLAACVNLIPGVRSVYRWQGRMHHDDEVVLLIKTTVDRIEALNERIVSLHPYELPELIAVEVAGGSQAYLDWLAQTVSTGSAHVPSLAGRPPRSGV